jgi:hypothetical protein
MFEEIEFEYPSRDFYEKLESLVANLPLVDIRKACKCVERSGSKSVAEDLSSLVLRLKSEIAQDFMNHENERDVVPHLVSYLIVMEKERGLHSLSVRTVLRSKYGHPGRVLYGTGIFKVQQDKYVSEDSYGN